MERQNWKNLPIVWLKIKNFRNLGSSELDQNETGSKSDELPEKGVLTAGHTPIALSGECLPPIRFNINVIHVRRDVYYSSTNKTGIFGYIYYNI